MLCTPALAQTGGVGIGTATPDASAALEISSTTRGLLPPRLTYAQRTGIRNPAAGLLVYQSDAPSGQAGAGYYYYTGTQWVPLQSDNLGNHTATQSLNLQSNALVGTGNDLGTTTGVGVRADGGLNLGQNTPGNNMYLGYQAGQSTSTGDENLFIGYRSGAANTTGRVNLFSGFLSGVSNTEGSSNQFIGHGSGFVNSTGSQNQFSGVLSGSSNQTGSKNLFVGYNSGNTNASGNNNTLIGYASDVTGDGLTNAGAIGYNAKVSQSNSLVLGGTGADAVRVGIGTTAPAAALDVQTTGSLGSYDFAFFARNGSDAISGYATNANSDVSIRASGRMVATEFNATSDERLKRVLGLSNGAADLALLRQLRITDYQMRDRAQYGERRFKKVIAQEVEQVFPQAVSQHTAFLPDIYALATRLERLPGDSLLVLHLPLGLREATATGQRVKLLGPSGEMVVCLARPASAGATALTVRGATPVALVAANKVFVYGVERADVRTVDYEALSMLHVSATQELAHQVAELQAQNAAMQQQNQVQRTRLDQQQAALQTQATQTAELTQRLRVLENTLGLNASAKQ